MILPTAKGPSGSVAIALERLGAPLLVTTADHPLLRTEWIAQFLMGAEGKCDLAVAVANRTVIERDVPGTKRTYIRLRELNSPAVTCFGSAPSRHAAWWSYGKSWNGTGKTLAHGRYLRLGHLIARRNGQTNARCSL